MIIECKGLKFDVRKGSSDEKTIREVIENNAYQKKYFKIEKGERWLDLGANVGAFTVLAASLGAEVESYEPDPFNAIQIKKNLELNGLKSKIIQSAVVHDERKVAVFNLWPDGQSWRNSMVRNKKGTTQMTVGCVNFFEIVKQNDCVKMDIEGSEIPILMNYKKNLNLKKLVFEWSFDADNRCESLKTALELLKPEFKEVKYSSSVEKNTLWNFFPPCTMVHCFNNHPKP